MASHAVEQQALLSNARRVGVETAREAGSLLRDRLATHRTIDFKGTVDLVTDADRASEELVARRIGDAFPDHIVFGEEGTGGPQADLDRSGYVWIVDPLDGTTNFAHGFPHFAVSIALAHAGETLLGVVYDPMLDELFIGQKGNGATLNDRPISVSHIDELIRALVTTGFPYDLNARDETRAIWDALLNITQGTRRTGSAALDLCYVACGRLDGFWERPLQPWDTAAGALVVQEAGGTVSSYFSDTFDPFNREVIATNGRLHQQMVDVVRRNAVQGRSGD
ncbi:MAG TPA: inositol monophosphatase family protein [Thermomicrobiales bacterium]|nr:inositol monophosphatase family protein [Thermomicrobiales bacterium]